MRQGINAVLMITMATILAGVLTAPAAGKPPLQMAGNGVKVDPIRVAAVKVVDGRLQVGEWVEYNPFGGRSGERCLYDCYGRAWGQGSTGEPVGGDTMPCSSSIGLSASSRWYFGGDYYLPYTVDDISEWESGTIESIGAAWWWLNDNQRSERCLLAFLLSNDPINTTCAVSPDSNVYTSGVILDFGVLAGRSEGYLYTDTTGLGVLHQSMPRIKDNSASHALFFFEDIDEFGIPTFARGPCQFMLWAAGKIRDDGLNACGDQWSTIAYDDDNPSDGVLDANLECYDYNVDFCPSPVSKCVCFGAVGCRPDYNGDGFLDGDDFDAFMVDYVFGWQAADYDGNGFVTGDDFDAFVIDFEAGC